MSEQEQGDAAAVAAASASVFDIGSFEVQLCCGVVDQAGEIRRKVVIRELLGSDRDVIGLKDVKRNGARMLSALLSNNVTSIDGIDLPAAPAPGWRYAQLDKRAWKTRMEFFASMCSQDRAQITIELAKRLHDGKPVKSDLNCADCGHRWIEEFDLDSFETRVIKTADYTLKGNPPRWMCGINVERRGRKVEAVVRLSDGVDEEFVSTRANTNIAEAARLTFERVLVTIDGEPFRKGIQIPAWLHDALWEEYEPRLPGVQLPSTVECEVCARTVLARISALSLLFGEIGMDRGTE